MDATQIKTEIRLLAILSKPRFSGQDKLKASRLLDSGVNFAAFKQSLDKHRVLPCAYINIRDHFKNDFPEQLINNLHTQYLLNVKKNKLFLKTIFTIFNSFKVAGIPVVSIKGIPLAQALYEDLAKRHFHDIDILIRPCDLNRANELLNQSGFRCEILEYLPAHLLSTFLNKQKDLVYVNSAGVVLELHLRVANIPTKLSIAFEEQLFTIHQNRVLYQPEAFLYLCWHGMNMFYHRIKWLCDLAIMIDTMDMDWDNMYATARRLDCLRELTISLVLAHLLFDTALPSQAARYYAEDRVCRWLLIFTINNINSNTLSYTGYTRCILNLLLLPTSWSTKLKGVVFLYKPNYEDYRLLPFFPKALSAAYYLVRPATLLWRRVRYIFNCLTIPTK